HTRFDCDWSSDVCSSDLGRLIAFEMQLGPFAVAQLRVYAELLQLIGKPPRAAPRMFVTDTLGSPYAEVESLGSWYGKISESRRRSEERRVGKEERDRAAV